MAKSIHPSLSCLLPFYTIPIFPLLNRKIFHLLFSILFLDAHYILNLFYTQRNILPEAICCCFFMPCYCLMVYMPCIHIPSFMATTANIRHVVIGKFSLFINKLPEAICCCLQTCYVYDSC